MKTFFPFYSGAGSLIIAFILSLCLTTDLSAQNEWTVSVWSPSWGDATTWQLRDSSNTVLLSGGPYGNGYSYTQSIETVNEPLSFTIISTLGDNQPYYLITCDSVVVEGQLPGIGTHIYSDLMCGVPVTGPNPTVTISGVLMVDHNCNGLQDSDDIPLGNVNVFSSVDGLLGASQQSGLFSFDVTSGVTHEIYTVLTDGYAQTISAFVDASDTTAASNDLVLSMCPEFDFHDLGVTWSHTPNTATLWSPGQVKTFTVCMTNHGITSSDGDILFQFTADPVIIVDNGGGEPTTDGDLQVLTFEVQNLSPQDEACFEISLMVDAALTNTTSFNVFAEVVLTSAEGLDYFDENNLLNQSFLSIVAGVGEFFCDQSQSLPGFPADLACEAAICAGDPFCCTNSWDGYCASTAIQTPECAGCLLSALLSHVEGFAFIDYNCNGEWDVDDIAFPDVQISSNQSGSVANSGADGFYSGTVIHNMIHTISSQSIPGFGSPESYEIIAPDTSAHFENINFGYCPVSDYFDLSLSLSPLLGDGISLADNFQVLPNHEVHFEICVTNNGAWSALGSISLEADDSGFFTLVDLGGSGTVDANSVLWEDFEWGALETQCFIVEFVLDSDAGIGETVSFQAVTTLDGSLPADQVPENNISQTVTVTVGDLTGGPYCDQIQSTPGFPYDAVCENVICASDPFCCNTQWDGFCASTAATEPLCIGCLESSNSASVIGNIFVDLDCDGDFGVDDLLVAGVNVFRNDQLVTTSNQSGVYSLHFPLNENVIISLQDLPGFTVNEHNVYSEVVQNFSDLDFTLCPDSGFINLNASITPIGLPPRPGFDHSYNLCVQNLGSLPSNEYEVVLDFTNLPGVYVVNDAGGAVSGTQITWSMSDLGVFEQHCFVVTFNVPSGTPPGTVMNPVLSVNAVPDPAADPYQDDNVHSFTHQVVAAYDPNDKTVNQPIVNFTEIEAGAGVELEYVIRFQNTGNFFATHVRVEDELPELLNINTIEAIHASHDYEIIFHPNNKVEWYFENIMLPDSTSDEPGSHGQIHFRITTVPDLQLEDVIENKASIFFDFKEPVITEYAVTTFMDCSEGSLSILPPDNLCVGEEFSLTANRDDFENYNWSIDGIAYEGEEIDLTLFVSGSVVMSLTATNAVCTLSADVEMQVVEQPYMNMMLDPWVSCHAEANIDVDPIGEVNWYLDGELMASGNPVTLFDSGLYMVTVQNECGMIENNVAVEIHGMPDEVFMTFDGEQLVVSPEGSSYMWFLNGMPMSQDGPAITPTESGDYSVIVYFGAAECNLTSNTLFVSVSIEESLAAQIQLFPNPARDVSTLTLPQGQWQVWLMDASGKMIRGFDNVTTSQLEIDLSSLARGVYFVNVRSDEGAVVKKLVVE